MSNLSELLPAGGGGKNVDFVASGTLGNGAAVVLKSDGTVEVVAETAVPASVGAESVFSSTIIYYTSVAMLSATKAIVTYRDGGNNNYGTACILTMSGTTITAGTPVVYESATSSYNSVTMLSSTKAIVAYQDVGNSSYGTACILDVSGTTITSGTPAVFESASSESITVSILTSTKAIVAYKDQGNGEYGTACILDVSGTTITSGTPAVFENSAISYTSIDILASTKAVVCYRDSGNGGYGTSCILDVSGSTITSGTPLVFNSGSTAYPSVAALTSTKGIVCYRNSSNSSYGTACILDVSGSTITAGTPAVFESASSDYISVASLTSVKAIVAYKDDGNSGYTTSCTLNVSGSTITYETPVTLNNTSSEHISITTGDDLQTVVCYGGNNDYGTSIAIQNAYTSTNLTSTNFLGITDAAITSGASGSVTIKGGLKSELSSLTPNSIYYVQSDGSVTTASTAPAVRIGKALSSTTLNLEFSS